jgi:hypothetical protein
LVHGVQKVEPARSGQRQVRPSEVNLYSGVARKA